MTLPTRTWTSKYCGGLDSALSEQKAWASGVPDDDSLKPRAA